MGKADYREHRHRLFISYSRRNKAEVYSFVEQLTKAGVDVWIDYEDIEALDAFPQRILDGLGHSHALLAWYSPDYAQSTYCQKEITAAWICSQRLTRNTLSRIFVINPVDGVAHITLGDVARQNFVPAPKDLSSQSVCIQAIKRGLAGLSDDFSAVREFRAPDWHPSRLQGSARFIGRSRELWSVHTALNPIIISESENSHVLVQLRGLGGIGKSLLAIEYASRFGASYPGGIYWLRAFGFDARKPMDAGARERERCSQIENLALRNDIAISQRDMREITRDLGRRLGAGAPYLWIVDDLPPGLDHSEQLPGWCAPSANGCTLVTTRSGDYDGVGVTIKVDVLELKPAIELLTRLRKPQTEQEWRDVEGLAEDLGRHALALAVAALLLETTDFAKLRNEISGAGSDPLGELAAALSGQLPGGHEKSIVTTLVTSVRMLDEEGLNVLRLACVLLGGTPIPLRVAQGVFRHAFALEHQAAKDYVTLGTSQLEAHSLANISPESGFFSVHSLVRYAILRGDPASGDAPEIREALRQYSVRALSELFAAAESGEVAGLELEIAHAKDIAPHPNNKYEVYLTEWIENFEYSRGHYRDALAMARRVLPFLEHELGSDDPYTLAKRGAVASYSGDAGDAREALRLYRNLLPDAERALGDENEHTLRFRNNLAHWTQNAGKKPEALRLFLKLLPQVQRLLGQDHRGTLTIRKNIADLTGATGEEQEALRLFQDLLPDMRRVLGDDDGETLSIRRLIARYTPEVSESLRIYRKLQTDEKRLLGPEHPASLMTRKSIAYLTGKEGDVQQALLLCLDLLPVHQSVLGSDHQDTLALRRYIAMYTAQSGDTHDALRMIRDLLFDDERVLGSAHPDTCADRKVAADWAQAISSPTVKVAEP